MKKISSYKLSAGLKAELNIRHRKTSNPLRNLHFSFDIKKIPFKGIGIFTGVFILITCSYLGVKSLYEIQSSKMNKAREAKLETYEQHLAVLKAEVASKGLDSEGYVDLTREYLGKKDVERAEEAALLAVEKNPLWRDAYINQGHVLLVANKFDKAKTAFEKALDIDPLCGQAHYFLSLTLQELKDNNAAKSEFAKAKQFGFETEIGG
jgi:tetratricopeptide (TPR) repeat protein